MQARLSTPVACTAVPHTVPRNVAPSAPPPAAPLDGWGAGRCTTSASALGAELGRVWAAEGAGESPRAHPPERRCACPVGVNFVATCNVYKLQMCILTCLYLAGSSSLLLLLAPCKLAARQAVLESRCAAGAARRC